MHFYSPELIEIEFLIIFHAYAGKLLSITQIAELPTPCYTMLHDQFRDLETAHSVWVSDCPGDALPAVDDPTRVDETHRCVWSSKTNSRRESGLTVVTRPRADAPAGQGSRATR